MTVTTMQLDPEDWMNQLNELIDHTKNANEKQSLIIFASALKPLLMQPNKIQTLLGKITI